MGVLERARAHLRRRRALAKRAAAEVARLWGGVDRTDIARSWASSVPAAVQLVSLAQATAAAQAGTYLDDLLDEYGLPAGDEGQVSVDSLAGVASDGRALETLLYQPAITALRAIKAGATVTQATSSGRFAADLITRTQVADAGRAADGVALTARPQLGGWVRMLSLPSCSRCIILAGRWYRWDAGFARHPACDCTAIPAPEDAAGDLRTDPKAAFESMSPEEQDAAFTRAGAQAIRDGVDIAQVVNARRGMTTVGVAGRTVLATREGARGRRVRLMPEQIYLEAGGDRDEALRLLRVHGYLL